MNNIQANFKEIEIMLNYLKNVAEKQIDGDEILDSEKAIAFLKDLRTNLENLTGYEGADFFSGHYCPRESTFKNIK